MLLPITVFPSRDVNELANAIITANKENKRVVLMPGMHLTKPGVGVEIPINKNGIIIQGSLGETEYSSIKRPDTSIDLDRSDNNYGLFFVPSEPTKKEWRGIKEWKTHTTINSGNGEIKTFQYSVIIRGAVRITDVVVDCNMGNQQLPENMPSEKIEHSCMLGFCGGRYSHQAYKDKFIFVAFKTVTINNVRTIHGGYADDILISRGYFRPNIQKVMISNLVSRQRVNNKRATISFSGLTQNAVINNCNIFKLEAEETSSRWSELPGNDLTNTNQFSYWKLNNMVCEMLDLAAKGQAIFLKAENIESTRSTSLYQLGGIIKNSTFNMQPHPVPLNRLNALIFQNIKWIFTAFRNIKGNFIGIALRPDSGEPCSATFIKNDFVVNGQLVTDETTERHCLIATEHQADEGNYVNVEFRNCTYDSRFGNDIKTCIAKVVSKGTWKFKISDFNGISIENALFITPEAVQTIDGDKLTIIVP